MSCHYFNFNNGRGIITLANGYKFGGFYFEWHDYLGPTKMKKNGNAAKRTGRKCYKVIEKWDRLSKPEKEKTRIYG
jgi:hypothetical protein